MATVGVKGLTDKVVWRTWSLHDLVMFAGDRSIPRRWISRWNDAVTRRRSSAEPTRHDTWCGVRSPTDWPRQSSQGKPSMGRPEQPPDVWPSWLSSRVWLSSFLIHCLHVEQINDWSKTALTCAHHVGSGEL